MSSLRIVRQKAKLTVSSLIAMALAMGGLVPSAFAEAVNTSKSLGSTSPEGHVAEDKVTGKETIDKQLVKDKVADIDLADGQIVNGQADDDADDSNAADTEGMGQWCKTLVPRLPGISKSACRQSGVETTGTMSLKGFPILAREVEPEKSAKSEGEPDPVRILLIGGIHGDELTSSAIVFKWLKWIDGPLSRQFHWMVAPVVNPDGLLARRPSRLNANGVDLNRNFPMPDWPAQAPNYWVKVTRSDPRRYPGRAALSEPESNWVHEQILRFRPNVVISVHAPFGLLDFDGHTTPPRRFGRLWLNRIGVYPGSLGNYSGMLNNVPVITIELPHALVMPPDSEVLRIWQDMLTWMRHKAPKGPSETKPAKGTLMPTSMTLER